MRTRLRIIMGLSLAAATVAYSPGVQADVLTRMSARTSWTMYNVTSAQRAWVERHLPSGASASEAIVDQNNILQVVALTRTRHALRLDVFARKLGSRTEVPRSLIEVASADAREAGAVTHIRTTNLLGRSSTTNAPTAQSVSCKCETLETLSTSIELLTCFPATIPEPLEPYFAGLCEANNVVKLFVWHHCHTCEDSVTHEHSSPPSNWPGISISPGGQSGLPGEDMYWWACYDPGRYGHLLQFYPDTNYPDWYSLSGSAPGSTPYGGPDCGFVSMSIASNGRPMANAWFGALMYRDPCCTHTIEATTNFSVRPPA